MYKVIFDDKFDYHFSKYCYHKSPYTTFVTYYSYMTVTKESTPFMDYYFKQTQFDEYNRIYKVVIYFYTEKGYLHPFKILNDY